MSFNGKVVIISGAGAGIGAATALLFAKQQANVVIVDINETAAEEVKEKCDSSNNKTIVIKADLSKDEEAMNVIERTIEEFGRIDVLVNNAGIVRKGAILDGSMMKTYDEVMNINLRAVVVMTNLVAPHLIKTQGCIINTSSIVGISRRIGNHYPSYAVSKAGVGAFTELSASELAPHGVRVNAVCPGVVKTSLLANAGIKNEWEEHSKLAAFNKCLDPEEVGDLILYLASDKAKSITGSSYVIDNGTIIK